MATPLFKFRLSDEERDVWQGMADECDMNLSEWIRDCCNSRIHSAIVEGVKECLPVAKPASEPHPVSYPPMPSKKLDYTGEHAIMFHKQQYEYVDEQGRKLWTTTPPF